MKPAEEAELQSALDKLEGALWLCGALVVLVGVVFALGVIVTASEWLCAIGATCTAAGESLEQGCRRFVRASGLDRLR